MPERDLQVYAEHLTRRRLPSLQQSMQMAHLCQLIEFHVGGVRDVPLTNYLFDTVLSDDDMDPQKTRDLSGFFD